MRACRSYHAQECQFALTCTQRNSCVTCTDTRRYRMRYASLVPTPRSLFMFDSTGVVLELWLISDIFYSSCAMRTYALSRRRMRSSSYSWGAYFFEYLDWREIGVLALHGIDIPVNSDSICEILKNVQSFCFILWLIKYVHFLIHICFSVIRNKWWHGHAEWT